MFGSLVNELFKPPLSLSLSLNNNNNNSSISLNEEMLYLMAPCCSVAFDDNTTIIKNIPNKYQIFLQNLKMEFNKYPSVKRIPISLNIAYILGKQNDDSDLSN